MSRRSWILLCCVMVMPLYKINERLESGKKLLHQLLLTQAIYSIGMVALYVLVEIVQLILLCCVMVMPLYKINERLESGKKLLHQLLLTQAIYSIGMVALYVLVEIVQLILLCC